MTFIKIDILKSGKKKSLCRSKFSAWTTTRAAKKILRRKLCYPMGIYDRKTTNDKIWNETIRWRQDEKLFKWFRCLVAI